MAGKDSDGENQQRGMSPVNESLQHVEESAELNRNPESREKEKPLKKKLLEHSSQCIVSWHCFS